MSRSPAPYSQGTPRLSGLTHLIGRQRTVPAFALAIGATLLLSGCASIDWERTGQLWLGSLCDSSGHCSYDGDGDPYTRL